MTFEELKKGNSLIITTRTKVEKKEIIELEKTKKMIRIKTKKEELILKQEDFKKSKKLQDGKKFFSDIVFAFRENDQEISALKEKKERLEDFKWKMFFEENKNKKAYLIGKNRITGQFYLNVEKNPLRIRTKWYVNGWGTIKNAKEMHCLKLTFRSTAANEYLLIIGKINLLNFSVLSVHEGDKILRTTEKKIFDDFKKPLLTKRRF